MFYVVFIVIYVFLYRGAVYLLSGYSWFLFPETVAIFSVVSAFLISMRVVRVGVGSLSKYLVGVFLVLVVYDLFEIFVLHGLGADWLNVLWVLFYLLCVQAAGVATAVSGAKYLDSK